MDDILIPMIGGNFNDIDQSGDDQGDSMIANNTAVLARESLWVEKYEYGRWRGKPN